MQDLTVKIYTTPTCSACKTLKEELKKSNYYEDMKEVNLLGDEKEFNFARDNGVLSVPTIAVFTKNQKFFLAGLRPISVIDEFITECIRY